jgi:hypothetical protein
MYVRDDGMAFGFFFRYGKVLGAGPDRCMETEKRI